MISTSVHSLSSLPARLSDLTAFTMSRQPCSLGYHPAWLKVLHEGLQHEVYALEARAAGKTCGFLPLAYVSGLFGRFLVSLPYLNSNGIIASSPDVESALVRRAIELAEERNVRHLELRHEAPINDPAFNGKMTSKVHMRLALPENKEKLWKGFDAKVRNQVRKGEKSALTLVWGSHELLDEFYAVLSHNMRDLGTPIYSIGLFHSILSTFPGDAEIALVRSGNTAVATALLLHGPGVTDVPTASSLREYKDTCANMFMYRHLLDRAVERKQKVFDFGRSTADGPTFQFKKQWGAKAHPACWQYHLRTGQLGEMRPDNPKYQRMIQIWQRLPVRLTQYIGPPIVRGIP